VIERTIEFGRPIFGDEERQAVLRVLNQTMLVHGPQTRQFEEAFAKFTGAPLACSVASCTAGLHLALLALDIEEGDEVIVPAQTHTATAHAVEYCRATPRFVDSCPLTGNMDLQQVEDSISERTKAIMLVHYLGVPVDMPALKKIASAHGLPILEDCALAVGTRIGSTHAGLLGDVGCFSFYPVKHMTTAEGGMVITQSKSIADKITKLRSFGLSRTIEKREKAGIYDVEMLGFNYRMNELEAALGIEQLKRVPSFLQKRESNYSDLYHRLNELEEVTLLHEGPAGSTSSRYCLSAIFEGRSEAERDSLAKLLKERGVGTSVYYPKPVPHFTYYKEKYGYDESLFPEASRLSYSSIAFSVGPHLSPEDIEYTASMLKDALTKAS
jgi:perosamine synthetase